MIRMLQVIGLVPPQYVLLSRRFYVFPLFPFRPLHRPDCLIYNNTLLDPFRLCLLVSYPVSLSLVPPQYINPMYA